jgi:hypothetical protein
VSRHAIAARTAAAVVALVAGAASWEHIASVALAVGERPWVAWSLPAAVDGLIVVGVMALMEDQRDGRSGRWSARLAVVAGVTMTLAANIASAEPTWTARAVAVAAPVSFLLAVEVLTRSGRVRETDPETGLSSTESAERPPGVRLSAVELAAQRPDLTPVQLAAATGVSERHARRALAAHNGRTDSTTTGG